MATKEAEERSPPYVAWKTFLSFLEHIKRTVIPPRIDNSMMPAGMSGGTRSHLRSAMRFLGLIGQDGVVTEKMRELAKAYGTEEWSARLGELISEAYGPVIGDLDVNTDTSKQLAERFRMGGHVEGEMLDRCIRFYLSALKAAGLTFSPHFEARSSNRLPSARKLSKKVGKTQRSNGNGEEDEDDEPDAQPPLAGLRKFTLAIPGKPDAIIQVPHNLTEREWRMIDSTLRAYVALNSEPTDEERPTGS